MINVTHSTLEPSLRRAGILALAAVYLVLGVLMAVCPAEPSVTAHAHQHGKAPGHALHSSLCIWACQANLQPGPVAAVLAAGFVLIVAGSSLSDFTTGYVQVIRFVPARAPPR